MAVYVVWEDSPIGNSVILSVHSTRSSAEAARDAYPGPTPTIDEMELQDADL